MYDDLARVMPRRARLMGCSPVQSSKPKPKDKESSLLGSA